MGLCPTAWRDWKCIHKCITVTLVMCMHSCSHASLQPCIPQNNELRGASKIKLKKVNKKRTVRVRRVIIFLNISRHPLLIWLYCCFHHHKFLKAVAMAKGVIVLLTPARNLNKVFWGFLVVFPLFNHFLGYVEIYQRVIWPKKLISKPLRGSNLPLIWRFF
jgi:hypothetical protein